MNKKYVIIAACILLPLSLLIMLLSLVPMVIEHFAFKDYSPAEKSRKIAAYHAWKDKKITLPPAALDPMPFSPGLIATASALDQAWKEIGPKAEKGLAPYIENKNTGKIIDSKKINFANLNSDLEKVAPLLRAFEALVSCPDYEISALNSAQLHTGANVPFLYSSVDFSEYECCTKWLLLKIRAHAHEGKQSEAFDTAALLVRSSTASPFDVMFNQIMAMTVCLRSSRTWLTVVRQCSDPALLRQALEKQNQLAPQLAFLSDESIPNEDLNPVGALREIKRRGLACSYQNLTGRQLTAQYHETQKEYLETRVLPLIKSNPTLTSQITKAMAGCHQFALLHGSSAANPKELLMRVRGNLLSPMMYNLCTLGNDDSVRIRSRACRTQFDLLRLETASKLYKLEHGQAPATAAALVPQYLPDLPADPFSADKKAPIRQAGSTFYSLGPDSRDDKAKLLYDPTNGTTSPGDLKLKPLN